MRRACALARSAPRSATLAPDPCKPLGVVTTSPFVVVGCRVVPDPASGVDAVLAAYGIHTTRALTLADGEETRR